MKHANIGDTVRVNYTGRLDDETVFDSTAGSEPVEFTLGSHVLIEGFEQAIEGMVEGEHKEIQIPSSQAFGPHLDEMITVMNKSEFPADFDPQIGEQYQLWSPNGQVAYVKILDRSSDGITVDANHPLAGKDLIFEIELVEIEQEKRNIFTV